MPVIFSVHFDGPITTNHLLSVRMMGRTYSSMQSAIDRAFIAERYGSVWKHARLSKEDYPLTEFLASYPQEGGIILDAIKNPTEISRRTIDRIYRSIEAPFNLALQGGIDEARQLGEQLVAARVRANGLNEHEFDTLERLLADPPAEWTEAYTRRSVAKEIDHLIAPVASEESGESTVEIVLRGTRAHPPLEFTAERARAFHRIVAARSLGPACLVNARIRDLDRGNKNTKPKAKILNLDSNREVVLHLSGLDDFHELHPFHTAERVVLIAAPFIEAGGFDPHGGDLFFVSVLR